MGTLQDDANDIGANMRELHALADASGNAALAASAATLHGRLAQGFADHIRPDHPELDWDAIAGATAVKSGGAHTDSGTKHEPSPDTPGG